MWLEQIEAVEPGQDKRIFECPRCEHRDMQVVKYR
jgi:transcription elongation factor Elf1